MEDSSSCGHPSADEQGDEGAQSGREDQEGDGEGESGRPEPGGEGLVALEGMEKGDDNKEEGPGGKGNGLGASGQRDVSYGDGAAEEEGDFVGVIEGGERCDEARKEHHEAEAEEKEREEAVEDERAEASEGIQETKAVQKEGVDPEIDSGEDQRDEQHFETRFAFQQASLVEPDSACFIGECKGSRHGVIKKEAAGRKRAGGLWRRALFSKRFVEDPIRFREVEAFDESAGFSGAVFAVHHGIFPFYGEGAVVTDGVQSANDFLELDLTSARAPEIPAAAWRSEVEMGGEDSAFSVEGESGIFHVHVIDAVGEGFEKLDGIHHLPVEMAGIEVEAEGLSVLDGGESPFGGEDVEGDFGWVHFEGEPNAALIEDIENGIPESSEVVESLLDAGFTDRRETVEHVPDAGSCEAVDDFDADVFGGEGGILHSLDGPSPFFFGISGAFFGCECIRTLIVVRIADQLTGEVVANGKQFQAVIGQHRFAGLRVGGVAGGAGDVDMIAPAGEFEAVIAPGFGFFAECFEGDIGELAGE